MEWANFLANAISSIGFPVVCCGCLLYMIYNMKTNDDKRIDELSSIIRDNTSAIKELSAFVKGGIKKDDV